MCVVIAARQRVGRSLDYPSGASDFTVLETSLTLP